MGEKCVEKCVEPKGEKCVEPKTGCIIMGSIFLVLGVIGTGFSCVAMAMIHKYAFKPIEASTGYWLFDLVSSSKTAELVDPAQQSAKVVFYSYIPLLATGVIYIFSSSSLILGAIKSNKCLLRFWQCVWLSTPLALYTLHLLFRIVTRTYTPATFIVFAAYIVLKAALGWYAWSQVGLLIKEIRKKSEETSSIKSSSENLTGGPSST